MLVSELEVLLIATSMIDPRKASKLDAESSRRSAPSDELDDSDDEESGTGMVNRSRSKNIRTGKLGRDSDDSDFDL